MAEHLLWIVIALFELLQVADAYHCSPSCGDYSYCCGHNICCRHRTSYTFYSVWYFWFIIALLIMACAGSCSYYRQRRRLLVSRRRIPVSASMPVAVVQFSNRNYDNGSVQFSMPPSYQEAISKSYQFPPPYYTTDLQINPHIAPGTGDPQLPPYTVNSSSQGR